MSNQIVVVHTFDCAPVLVYAAWISSDTIVDPVTAVTMNARVGGLIEVRTGDDPAWNLSGRFVQVDEAKRLTYTWRWGSAAEETLVDVLFHDLDGTTMVEVTHSGFLDSTSMANHLSGWTSYFAGLATYL